jgi:hypothetical protein
MIALAGIVLVLAAMSSENRNPYVCYSRWNRFVCGLAVGSIVTANRPSLIAPMAKGWRRFWGPSAATALRFFVGCKCFTRFRVNATGRPDGARIHVDDSPQSRIFSPYPELLADGLTLRFLCDSLRMLVIGAATAQELDPRMDLDVAVSVGGAITNRQRTERGG